jgi:hypothetical protein
MRQHVGTSADYIGTDPYQDRRSILYVFGHGHFTLGQHQQTYAAGSNMPVVMENGGNYSDVANIVLAALARGGFYDTYEMYGPDDYGLYVQADTSTSDYEAVSRGTYVQSAIDNYKFLSKVSYDLASKRGVEAGGNHLTFYNIFNNGSLFTGSFGDVVIDYAPTSNNVGISIARSAKDLVVVSTGSANFTLSGLMPDSIASV